jgi:NADH-quinone oxidoreductase subunit C
VSTPPWRGRVAEAYAEGLGGDPDVQHGFGPVSVDVPAQRWVEALTAARDVLGCTFFDWLSAVDESTSAGDGSGFRVVCHLAARRAPGVDHLLVRTLVPRAEPVLASAAGVFAGARWHERETHEMFGVVFTEGGDVLALERLLLPEELEGHPLRKDFALDSRVDKDWPGAKEPGESAASMKGSRSRRRARPPGVPEPEQRGPR